MFNNKFVIKGGPHILYFRHHTDKHVNLQISEDGNSLDDDLLIVVVLLSIDCVSELYLCNSFDRPNILSILKGQLRSVFADAFKQEYSKHFS